MIHPNSREAYRNIQPRLNRLQAEVLNYIAQKGCVTDRDIVRGLGWEINRVTPRRGELVKMGLIEAAGSTSSDGHRSTSWRVKQGQLAMFEAA